MGRALKRGAHTAERNEPALGKWVCWMLLPPELSRRKPWAFGVLDVVVEEPAATQRRLVLTTGSW